MDIHEYQAKEILARFGVAVPRGRPRLQSRAGGLSRPRHRRQQMDRQGADPLRRTRQSRRRQAVLAPSIRSRRRPTTLFGKRLVTQQTGPQGKTVYRVYVEGAVAIKREIYLGFVLDRKSERVMVVASSAGGMEIEEIAEREPEIDHPQRGRARRRHAGLPGARDRLRSRAGSGADAAGGHDHPRLLQSLRGARRDHGRDQSAGRHRGQPSHRARRQDDLRRQRPVPPAAYRGAARQVAGGCARDPRRRSRPLLCRPRRRDRLHRQWRRPRHGDHGHDQGGRRRARQLPRYRRRRHA